jgi:hypothetical protein
MCDLHTTRKSAAEIAAHFRAQIPLAFNAPEGDAYPGRARHGATPVTVT